MRDRQSYAPFADTQPCSRIMDIRPKSQVTVTIQPSIEITGHATPSKHQWQEW